MKPQHFIHYLPRRIVSRYPMNPASPWFAEVQALDAGFTYPLYHTSRRKTGPTRKVIPGDCIWLVSQIFSPWGALPPALDARIDVESVEERDDGSRRFVAAKTSSWFPLADATDILKQLETRDGSGRRGALHRKKPDKPVGHSLQSMRLLASADLLQTWSQKLTPQQSNFISYRICDGTSSAYTKVKDLLATGEVVFWDRWCFPRRLAERRELVDDAALNDYLLGRLRQSKMVWGVESKKYSAKDSYSAKEKAEAIRLGIYQPVPVQFTSTGKNNKGDEL